jgi:hypothetical protein
MALRMVALSRAADGRWFARKGIPEDVREECQKAKHSRRAHVFRFASDNGHAVAEQQ